MTNTALITIVWLLLVELEAFRNWYWIVKRKISPRHKRFTVQRVIAGIVFCVVVMPFVPMDNYIVLPPMMGFSFWFLFHVSLNLMRGKSILYFGEEEDPEEDSWLDKQQSKYPLPWVWFMFLFAAAFILLFNTGISAVVSYDY